MIRHLRRDARHAALESLFQKRDQENRHDQEDEEDAGELHHDHEHHHGRMAPMAVGAVAGRAQRLGRPLEAVPERARLSLEPRHPGLIEQRRGDEEQEQTRDEPEEAPRGTVHGCG